MNWTLPSRRDLRLASGLVLFGYIGLHLLNHALGLVSVAAAERALDVALRVWQSVPGTLLLYGAAATHVALALNAIYRRRTLRMPPLELLRIALGLGIPLLVIGHAVNTRLAWEAYRLAPQYSRVVWSLWISDGEGRQLALLVPGWLHGCLGVNFAFKRRGWFQRLRPALFAVALLLPVLGALGFLAMGKELAADAANRAFLDSNAAVDAGTRVALNRIRDALLATWFALIGGIFVAREVRAVLERRRSAVVTIAYPQRNARVPAGWTVLEASRSHHIPHVSMCGGQARCSTCRVRVVAGEDHCPPPAALEQATLARIGSPPGVRLACQLRPTGDIAVIPLLAAAGAGAGRGPAVRERDFAIVDVAWRNRAQFAREHLPQDVVYLSGLFAETADTALRAAGGAITELRGDRITAVFGLDDALPAACRDALQAAAGAERALGGLRRRCAAEFGTAAEFSLVVHAGHGAVARDPPAGHALAAGTGFDAIDALRAGGYDAGAPLLVTSRAWEGLAAAADLPWQDVAGTGGDPPLRVAAFPHAAALLQRLP